MSNTFTYRALCRRRRPKARASLSSLSLSLSLSSARRRPQLEKIWRRFEPVPRQRQGYDPSIVVQVDLTIGDPEILDDDLRKAKGSHSETAVVRCFVTSRAPPQEKFNFGAIKFVTQVRACRHTCETGALTWFAKQSRDRRSCNSLVFASHPL